MFTYDGKYYDVSVTSLKRSFSKLSTDKSGRVQSGDMFIDLVGTYYNYNITIEVKQGNVAEFDRFWEDVSAPKPFVKVVFPYNQSELTFLAYVTQGDQMLIRQAEKENRWGPLSLNFISKSPQRRPI